MRALVLDSPRPVVERPLRLADVPRPMPGPGQVLVRVRACAVCRTDLHVVEGELPSRRSVLIPGHQVVGEVAGIGSDVAGIEIGSRVGVAWLHRTCGRCRFCLAGRENLCEAPDFTGWTVDGGFAEYMVAQADFTYALPAGFPDARAAPLLCAGIIGYRGLALTGLESWSGARLGIHGFGAAGHVAIQIARARGAEVYVCTRDPRHRKLALELGAVWSGGTTDRPPVPLAAAVVFAPAGEIVPLALSQLDRGATLVLAGIHMSEIPPIRYELLYWERTIRSVANNTREDGRAFLEEAARVGVETRIETFPLEAANEALIRLKHDAIHGAGVLVA